MSALAGIFKFDPHHPVDRSELMRLARGIDRIGPDGGGEYVENHLGMAYRAFHTTAESHLESQPMVGEGCVFTWDGRLDNREEIRTRLSRRFDAVLTDLEIAFESYREWGTHCFRELVGDWAIAIWDGRDCQLTLARDYAGVRRLFYRQDTSGIAWCSILEPLVLTSPMKLHLDLDYVAGCLYPRPPIERSPYAEIRAVPPSHFESFHLGGKCETVRYWGIRPEDRIRYSSDADYEHHFRDVLRTSVKRRLRADRTVLAELSGGVDSSSIVCVADDISQELNGPFVETLSYYDTEEPSGDERPYFSLVEELRGRVGHHISKSDFAAMTQKEALEPLPSSCFRAVPGYFAQSLSWATRINEVQTKVGARVILSGLGGDELLGGIQYEVPELGDYLISGELASFARAAFAWSLIRKKTVIELLGDTVRLLMARRNPTELIGVPGRHFPWSPLKPITQHSLLKSFADWRELSPTHVTIEWCRYSLASQLTCTDPPLIGCNERRYPYLDRSLFSFLAAIPRDQIIRAGRRRHLMRRALRNVVPEGVLFRKTKWFGSRSVLAAIRDKSSSIESLFDSNWVSDGISVYKELVQNALAAVQIGVCDEGVPLISAIAIEQWMRVLLERGFIEPFESSD